MIESETANKDWSRKERRRGNLLEKYSPKVNDLAFIKVILQIQLQTIMQIHFIDYFKLKFGIMIWLVQS